MRRLTQAKGTTLTALITLASGFGFALFGYDQGVFGAFLGNESFLKTFKNPDTTVQGHMTATYDLGCFIGAVGTMWYGNKVGSRRNILLGCAILIVGAVLQTTSYHTPQMIAGRLVAGVGNGMNTASIPVWQSETASARHRGHIMVLQLVLCQLGQVVSQWLNYAMTFVAADEVSWRFPLAFQAVFALFVMALVPFLPDSPRWLITRDRNEEAYEVLRRLGGASWGSASSPGEADDDNDNVRAAFDEIHRSVQHEMSFGKISLRSLAHNDRLQTTRRMILGAGTQFMQQWSGINAVTYYLPVVFASLGIGRNLSLILAGCSSLNFLFSTAVGALGIERVGRKRLMICGAASQSLCLSLVAISLGIGGTQWNSVAVAFVFGFVSTFGLTWIAVPWMYPAEVNTQRMRVAGAGVATATNWISNYAVVLVTPLGIGNLGWGYYVIYAVLNAVFVPVLLLFYVETARLSLEEIDALFERRFAATPDLSALDGKPGAQHEEKSHLDVSHVSISG
ncbi:general substrate transporter [Aspergillus insuetus]